MSKKVLLSNFIAVFLITFGINVYSQKVSDPIIVTIDNKKITRGEFLRTYTKNNPEGKFDKKSLDEYMELFINFKLKVVEAERLGFDTVASFKSEFNSYREQLAKPYLTDKEAEEKLIREVYDRLHYDVRARQIIIRCGELLPPNDTIEKYKRAIEAYNKLMAGEPWDSVYNHYSDERSSRDNKGDLGYFTALQMIYPFETACYNAKVGLINKPIRTHIGYHIIQVLDKRPSLGEIKVQHIMIAFPENASPDQRDSAYNLIKNIYDRIQKGEPFEEMAKKYSDDKRSAVKGGELNWFGTGQMIQEFEREAFALKNDGEVSKPFRTAFGWHLLRRVAVRPLSSYDEMKETLKFRISRDNRGEIPKQVLIEKAKKEYNYVQNKQTLLQLAKYIDSTAYQGLWKPEKASVISKNVLFKIGNKTYTAGDFATYIAKYRFKKPATIEMSINYFYNQYLQKEILNYVNSQLENKYDDFKYLLQEFHDGILLFNLMEQKVWRQASIDTVGFMKFYEQHKNEYKWSERVEALVVSSYDKNLVDKAYNFASDFWQGKITADQIWKNICEDTTEACFNCQVNLFEKGDNQILDSIGWNLGISPIVFKENKYGFFVKKQILPPRPKTFEEAKGVCLADYQTYLENQFVGELRKKYKVQINQKVLASLIKNPK